MARPLWRVAGEVFAYVQLFREAPEASRSEPTALRAHLISMIEEFTRDPDARAVPAEELEAARFALVAWVDEMINTSSWSNRDEWRKEPLQLQLYQTVRAGNEFYDRLRALRADQLEARAFYYVCLALGFRGQVTDPGERRALLQGLYDSMRVAGSAHELAREPNVAPSAYDLAIRLPERRATSIWTWILSFAVLSLGSFAAFWFVLGASANGVPLPPR